MDEVEAKFYVRDLKGIENRLRGLEATLVEPRTLEVNLRFDTPTGELRRLEQILRLRRGNSFQLTFKGPSQNRRGILQREEIEFKVDDFDKALQFLEALGYEVVFRYQKYRTTYRVGYTLIMLDELPFGQFVEIEGQETGIREMTIKLKLKDGCAIAASYHALYERIASGMAMQSRDLTFEGFTNKIIQPEQLGVQPAD